MHKDKGMARNCQYLKNCIIKTTHLQQNIIEKLL